MKNILVYLSIFAKKIFSVPIHPLLVATWPVLSFYVEHIVFVNSFVASRSLLISILMASFIYTMMYIFFRDLSRAAVNASLVLLVFVVSGHVNFVLPNNFSGRLNFAIFYLFGFLILVLANIWVGSNSKVINKISEFFNVTSYILIVFVLVQTLVYRGATYRSSLEAGRLVSIQENSNAIESNTAYPDIYMIVLDAYGRADVLEEFSEFDNTVFLEKLEGLGFYVANCSQSNYSRTKQSVTSVFYMDYLENLSNPPLMKLSPVKQQLEALGYTSIAFEHSSEGQYDFDEQIRISKDLSIARGLSLSTGVNEFESDLIQFYISSPLENIPFIQSKLPLILRDPTRVEFKEHYDETMYILDKLPFLPETDGPRFVFAHILAPHYPYIFSPNGEFVYPEEKDENLGYRNNVEFLNDRLVPIIEAILSQSENPPIIIIQGDHGPNNPQTLTQRMSILNAYYVNEEAKKDLYPTITPINSFRIIFNEYFGSHLPLLEDLSHFLLGRPANDAELQENECVPADL